MRLERLDPVGAGAVERAAGDQRDHPRAGGHHGAQLDWHVRGGGLGETVVAEIEARGGDANRIRSVSGFTMRAHTSGVSAWARPRADCPGRGRRERNDQRAHREQGRRL